MKFLSLLLLMSSIGFSYPAFEMKPVEGQVLVVACESEDSEECIYDAYSLLDTPLTPLSSKRKRFPGLKDAPAAILDAINSAASAMGDINYVHVAITHKNTTYEYMYDRTTGWNSFRAVPVGKCTLKCYPKTPKSGSSEQ